jgi:ribosome-associated toxin RatA of RatAB toxin-antitoxin module
MVTSYYSMTTINRSALVMFSTEQMYQLVNDVEAYPEFIPNCSSAKCIAREDNFMEGALQISKAGISKWFSTHNDLTPNERIDMKLIDGPFKYLKGTWLFTKLSEEACKVELHIEFEFSSKMIELAFGKVFNHVITSMVNAFTQRAKQVYGK